MRTKMCDKCDKLPLYLIHDAWGDGTEGDIFIHKDYDINFYDSLRKSLSNGEIDLEQNFKNDSEYDYWKRYVVKMKIYKDNFDKIHICTDNSLDEYKPFDIEITNCPFCGKEF